MDRPYDIYEERIQRASHILDTLPQLDKRIGQINARLFRGGMASSEFRRLVDERISLVKQRDSLQREVKENFHLTLEEETEPIEITFNIDLKTI